jgi:hypothetical protein
MEISGFSNYTIHPNGDIFRGNRKVSVYNANGYYKVNLWSSNNQKILYLHRLLAEHFIPNPNNLPCVDHIDRNKSNNSLENLRWVSYSGNSQNLPLFKTNTSGHQYICRHKNGWKFSKMIQGNRIQRTFETIEEALAFRDSYMAQCQ